jgi:hypothetical protein
MPIFSRLASAPAIMSRSSARPVSFSTIDAMISASYGVLVGDRRVARRHSCARWRRIAW